MGKKLTDEQYQFPDRGAGWYLELRDVDHRPFDGSGVDGEQTETDE